MPRLLTLTAFLVVLAAAMVSRADADEPVNNTPPKNLKVMPRNTPRADVMALMKQFNKALGVKCAYCHNTRDYAADGNEHKTAARRMMKMTEEIHARYFNGEKDPVMKYNCYVCHRGAKEPELKPQ